jgi:hypothetical protein
VTPQERAEWIRFFTEERLAPGYSALEAHRYTVRELVMLEERQEQAYHPLVEGANNPDGNWGYGE